MIVLDSMALFGSAFDRNEIVDRDEADMRIEIDLRTVQVWLKKSP